MCCSGQYVVSFLAFYQCWAPVRIPPSQSKALQVDCRTSLIPRLSKVVFLFLLPHLKLNTSSSSTYSLDIFWPIYCYYSACNALFMVAWFHNGSTTFHPGQNLHVKYKKKIAANILESCVHKFYRKFQASNLAVSKHLIGIKANINTCF